MVRMLQYGRWRGEPVSRSLTHVQKLPTLGGALRL